MQRNAFLLFAALALGLLPEADGAGTGAALRLDILARDPSPGEPLRIVVSSPTPLSSVDGEMLGRPLAFVADGAERTRWSAWGAIGLDQEPGSYTVSVRASGETGPALNSTSRLSVLPKSFPEQHLTVEEKYVSPPARAQDRIARERRRLDALYSRRSVRPTSGTPFERPVPGEPTSRFGLRRFFNGQPRSPHSGLDLRASTGTPVAASGPGEVVLADDLYFSGNTVILDHGAGLFTIYAHLSRIDVVEGHHVPAGTVLGLSGATGRVTGPHLHWGARVGQVVVDPRALQDPVLFDVNHGP